MRATFPFVQLAVLMACLPVSAQQLGESPLDWFHRMDRNQDGKLSRQEVPIPQFKDFDADGDGFVTRDEFKAYYTKRRAGVGPPKPAAQPAPEKPGALFRRIDFPGFSDIVEGTNGIALADLNHDGLVDIVATYTEPNRGLSNNGHHLRVFINQGNFRFQVHPIIIRESKLTGENFGPFPQIPNLVDFNGDGLLDMFITRHAPFWAGKRWPGVEPLGNTLLLGDGAWDTCLFQVLIGFRFVPNLPYNGSHYLIRQADGTYDWAPVYDFAHPVPEGRSLDATRRICLSPLTGDRRRIDGGTSCRNNRDRRDIRRSRINARVNLAEAMQ